MKEIINLDAEGEAEFAIRANRIECLKLLIAELDSKGRYLSIYQFIRHLQSFGSGRHSRRSLMARRRPRVNQDSLPRASLAGWRSGCFFRAGLACWLGPTCRSRPPNRGREP